MNNFLIPGDYASFELVSKDYCTVFISFQMPTCHLCGIVLPLEILFQVELNKLACLLQSTGKLCVLGICYVCSSHCPLGAFKVMNQAPKIARLTPNHGFKKNENSCCSYITLWITSFDADFNTLFQAFFNQAEGQK